MHKNRRNPGKKLEKKQFLMSIASCYFACFVLFLAFVLYGPFVIVPLNLTLSTLFETVMYNLLVTSINTTFQET